jgi:hypothetical protein
VGYQYTITTINVKPIEIIQGPAIVFTVMIPLIGALSLATAGLKAPISSNSLIGVTPDVTPRHYLRGVNPPAPSASPCDSERLIVSDYSEG